MPATRPAREPKAAAPAKLTPARIHAIVARMKLALSPTRLTILILLDQATTEVGGICERLGHTCQPAVSHQLALLRHGGLVEADRHGRNVRYGLTDAGRAILLALDTLTDSPHRD